MNGSRGYELRDRERGVALAIALAALVVVGALAAAAFWVAVEEQRIGESQHFLQRALGAADAGAAEILEQWDPDTFNVLPVLPGAAYPVRGATPPGDPGAFEGLVRRLGRALFVVDVRAGAGPGRGGRGVARQRIGLLATTRPLALPFPAALTTPGDVRLSGDAVVDGSDAVPNSSWTDCAAPDSVKPGVRTTPEASIDLPGDASLGGAPPLLRDATVARDAFAALGDLSYDMLAERARIRLAAGQRLWPGPATDARGTCDKAVPTNWGDGQRHGDPCGGYFPVIAAAGDLTVRGGQGQGILLVGGDLLVEGPFEFLGVVLVQGRVRTEGDGMALLSGMVLVGGAADAPGASVAGDISVQYSKCAIIRALESIGLATVLRSRSFLSMDDDP